MKKQNLLQLFALLIMAISFVACSNDDDTTAEPDDEEEEITRVELTLTEPNSVPISTTYIYDLESNNQDVIKLKKGYNYQASLAFFNEDEVVTTEIEEESDEHLICFTLSDYGLAIVATDVDSNGKEIGLESAWAAQEISTGSVNIKLKHQPDLKENTAGVNCDLGGTDVSVIFNYVIE